MKTNENYPIDIIDIAYQIIALNEENQHLKRELKHYKELNKINCNATKDSIDHNMKMVGTIFEAVLNPDSVINKGHEAIIKEQFNGDNKDA